MVIKSKSILLLILALVLATQAQTPSGNVSQSSSVSEIPTVAFCDLLSKSAEYDARTIRTAALYHSGFEWSAFSDSACEDNKIWVEFDPSLETSNKSDILKKLQEAIYHYPIDIDEKTWAEWKWLDWQTELRVTGFFYKAKEAGYGHLNMYQYKIVITGVEEVGALKRVDLLAKDKANQ